MNNEFGYPAYGADGVQVLTTVDGIYQDALMNTAVHRIEVGEEKIFCLSDEEMAFLLIEGAVTFFWNGQTASGDRKSCFDDGAQVCGLHVSKNTTVTIRASRTSEVFVVSTENEQEFPAKFYPVEEIRNVTSCADLCGNTCERKVTTLFDDVTAPYSNLVPGETYPRPGKWCGYPPHEHPQPEVYYYRIDRPEGFGFCGVGSNAYVIKDRCFSLLAHGAMHPQVTAPGYHMYIIWVIRHLPGNPWHRGPNLPEYHWLETKA
jgi:5-deoxy-glucuronate isomerase